MCVKTVQRYCSWVVVILLSSVGGARLLLTRFSSEVSV